MFPPHREQSFFAWLKLVMQLRKHAFDMVIDTQIQFSTLVRALLPFFTGACYRIGYRRAAGFAGFLNTHEALLDADNHGALLFLDLIKTIGIEPSDDAFEVYFSESDSEYIAAKLKNAHITPQDILIGLHPGNVDSVKLWSKEKFAALGDTLAESYGARIVFTGAPGDVEYVREVSSLMRHTPLILAGETSLPQLSALIARLDLLVSIDTVSVHIAAATDTPTIGLYGKTYIYRWLPWNKRKQIYITGYHDCAGCWLGDYFNRIIPTAIETNACKYQYACIKNISVEEVAAAARLMLQNHCRKNVCRDTLSKV